VRELLAGPLAAADAATLFYRTVPGALRRFVDEASAAPQPQPVPGEMPAPLRDLLDVYLGELAEVQRILRTAVRGAPIDGQALVLELRDHLPSADRLRAVAAGVDQVALDRATTRFLNATAHFVRALRESDGRLRFPDKAVRFDSAVGVVAIGSHGDDVHGPDAAVIVDPGGNDTYVRAPAMGGVVSVIIDLGGDDRYRGSDLAVHALSAIVDFSGNDSYVMTGPGLGAAIAGAAVLVDFSGDDSYAAEVFGQGAAAVGLGVLVDLGGKDTYRLRAGGQGFGLAGGVGLLWDRGGNDAYVAGGLPDVYGRGGGRSWAQGAALGARTTLGGGIGILRDDAGNDLYEAEMFAQGTGYYYGLGLLWDGGGDDRYRAVRYAQGNGVHEAVGLLRDESGNDSYELSFGVGQGMGLDLAVGVLFDGSGDDSYQAQVLAQGAATANGVGLLVDTGGADRWSLGADPNSWGRAEWSRRLPTSGLLVYDSARAVFVREGKVFAQPRDAASYGGPYASAPPAHEASGELDCPTVQPGAADNTLSSAEALRKSGVGFAGGAADAAAYAETQRRLTARLRATLAELPADDFNVSWALSPVLRCAFVGAAPGQAAEMWIALEQVLAEQPATPFAGAFAFALRARPPPPPQLERILAALDAQPGCGVRSAALRLRGTAAADTALRASAVRAAESALRSPCWRLQASALAVLRQLGAVPADSAARPSFLRGAVGDTVTK